VQRKRNLDRLGKVLAESEVLAGEVRTGGLMDVPAGVIIKSTGAEFPADWSEEQSLEFGRQLHDAQVTSVWVLIDWLKYSVGKWGEKYADLALHTGYSEKTLRNMCSVESRLSVRQEGLEFGHHASVAVLGPAQQRSVLNRAAKEQWTIEKIRAHVAATKDPKNEPPVQAHPEIKKLNRARAYVGRISQEEIGRMNEGEQSMVQELVEQLSDELQAISERLKEDQPSRPVLDARDI
jgi:hypothetical protein